MKKIPFILTLAYTLFFLPIRSHGISIITEKSCSEIKIESNSRVDKFVKIPFTQLKKLTGKKLNFFQRLSYNLLKLKVRHNLKKDPNFRLNNYISEPRKSVQAGQLLLLYF